MRTRDLDFVLLTLARDGRIADQAALDTLAARLPGATDCFVFSHGWLYDREEARQEAARFFSLLDGALAPVGDRAVPLRVAVHWPSKPFGDGETRGAAEPELLRGLGDIARGEPGGVSRLLLTVAEAEVPRGPEDELELDGLLRVLRGADTRGGSILSPAHALSFWLMKQRAGEVGERLGREHLAPLLAGLRDRAPRLHLVGHSFGARLVASAVRGGLRPRSLTLLQAAFSAFAFAPEVPGIERPGFYHELLAERHVSGPVVALHSVHDRALTVLYPAVTGSGEIDRGRGAGRTREIVARSALGAVGARGVGASEVELLEVQRIGLPRRPVVNVDGSRVVRASEWLVGAHRDIHHPEIARLIAMAAGLVQGGGGRDRPRLLTHAQKGGSP